MDQESASSSWRLLWGVFVSLSGRRNEIIAALNGAVGDDLERKASPLAINMSLLADSVSGNSVLNLDLDMVSQLPKATGKIVIFAHGLMCTERIWSFPLGKRQTYGDRLFEDAGVSPVYLRYNTGRHISTNGRELARLLERLVSAWPVEVEEVNLVGYSMGGLIARSASHYGYQEGMSWIGSLKRMHLLGSPLRGAPLEQVTHIICCALRTIPNSVTKLIAHFFNQRSDGVKDLRHGYLVDEDWLEKHPDELSLGRKHLVPLVPGVNHYVVAGSLTEDEHHPVAKVFGDILVPPYSAKDERFDGTPTERAAKGSRVFPGLNHLDIVNHNEVYQQILDWWNAAEGQVTE